MRKLIYWNICILFVICVSCSNRSSIKKNDLQVVRNEDSVFLKTDKFSFTILSDVAMEKKEADSDHKLWFNLEYVQFQATIYCSYMDISKTSLQAILEDNRRLINRHLSIDGLNAKEYTNENNQVYGVLYDLGDHSTTPIQFYLTDSTNHFLRGSLYYNIPVKADSAQMITQSIKNDISNLMENLHWGSVK